MPSPDDLPAALPAMWRVLKRGYAAEPRLLVVSFGLSLLSALPDALLALWFKLLADGVTAHDRRLAMGAAVGLGVSAPATWFLRVMSGRVRRCFRERLTIALEAHVAQLQAAVAGIEHHDAAEYLNRLAMLRDQVFVLDHIYMSVFSTCGWILRLGVTVGLLMSIHPALGLLAVFAVPTVLTATWRPGVERAAQERAAPSYRLARHLFVTATTAPPGKEVRVTGIGDRLTAMRRAAWDRGYGPDCRSARGRVPCGTRWRGRSSALGSSAPWRSPRGRSTRARATCCWCWRPARGCRRTSAPRWARSASCAGSGSKARDGWPGSRTTWPPRTSTRDATVPERLADGIRLEHVSFAYPGTRRLVLEDVCLDLEPGSVVAVVGENGAGKTTLVKLLCRMYRPTSGRILVNGADLACMPAGVWRSRLAGAFQDFYRFEFRARQTVGVGDVPRLDDEPAVVAAVGRAGADDVVARLRAGLETQLGPTWPEGVEVSFGQWQKLALARGFMRDHPLLLVLDEPTAALDAETEHALFERYAAAARGGSNGAANGADGRITILVSHRFSTVRMADQIVVLDGATWSRRARTRS